MTDELGPTRSDVTIAGLTLDQWNRREVEAPYYPDERMHLAECGVCGQTFDQRYLGDALYHGRPEDHLPLTGTAGFKFEPVPEPGETLFRWGQ
ncbi:MAG: hypothetical protein M3N39_13840 [Pseudomonadota bacterium]|nr:hypothetical protein [Pseudomonadota bacterium]